ncbi:MAG: beta-propeller domain-containing protein [Clostridiaceae bacterium]
MFGKKFISVLLSSIVISGSLLLFHQPVNAAVNNGWVFSNNTWYYYQNGTVSKDTWAKDSKGWCYLNASDGSWIREGWAKDSKGWCYIQNGYWADHEMWAKDSKGWCYIGGDGYWDGKSQVELPLVKSFDNFIRLTKESGQRGFTGEAMFKNDTAEIAGDSSQQSGTGGTIDYSGTNLQVEGVDEADIVKTDGKYIYYVKDNEIKVVLAYPASGMKVLSTIDFDNDNFSPRELYVDGDRLTVVGGVYGRLYSDKLLPEIYPYIMEQTTYAYIYDIGDRSNIKMVRKVEVSGDYLTSRKIGSYLYLIANKYTSYYRIMEGDRNIEPYYVDSASGTGVNKIALDKIQYFPDCPSTNFITIAAIDTASADKTANVTSYLGYGENVYASKDNIYITAGSYEIMPAADLISGFTQKTKVFKFSMDGNNVNYSASGEVPGYALNQFSMDEYNGGFRIATNANDKNNLYVLDSNMKITGKIEGIAPGERIYSTRFLKDRAYMVTFRQIDPLFVIDLKDPKKPVILGKLKIPGYSEYIHPYDDNHIIGFGKDTVTVGGNVLPAGLRIALFDITDVANPKEMHKVSIGSTGTDSEVLYNHKALLFSKEKDIMALPVTVMSGIGYGSYEFQGAYVFGIDLDKGFMLKEKITHLSDADITEAGKYYYLNYDKFVKRILYIGDTIYTISNSMIKAGGYNVTY